MARQTPAYSSDFVLEEHVRASAAFGHYPVAISRIFKMPEPDYRQSDFQAFLHILSEATRRIQEDYFQVRVALGEDSIYRERVYCYELYHHMRDLMAQGAIYQLDGELDKAGHPLLHDKVGAVKPDFLVHQHGEMNNNIVAIEVKPINAANEGIVKDVGTLCNFIRYADYYRAIYLVYGGEGQIDKFVQVAAKGAIEIPPNSFRVLWHERVGHPARAVWTNQPQGR